MKINHIADNALLERDGVKNTGESQIPYIAKKDFQDGHEKIVGKTCFQKVHPEKDTITFNFKNYRVNPYKESEFAKCIGFIPTKDGHYIAVKHESYFWQSIVGAAGIILIGIILFGSAFSDSDKKPAEVIDTLEQTSEVLPGEQGLINFISFEYNLK